MIWDGYGLKWWRGRGDGDGFVCRYVEAESGIEGRW